MERWWAQILQDKSGGQLSDCFGAGLFTRAVARQIEGAAMLYNVRVSNQVAF